MTAVWPNGSTMIPTVTDEYGMRTNPVSGAYVMHYGIDIVGFALNRSPFRGTVMYAQYNGGAGNQLTIRRLGSNDEVRIKHNASFLVKVGDIVDEGQPVGVMGTTGDSTGVHCHYETWPGGGSTVNPRIAMAAWISSSPAGGGSAPLPTTTRKREDTMRLAWDNVTPSHATLFTELGSTPVPNQQVYDLLYRHINNDQAITPFAASMANFNAYFTQPAKQGFNRFTTEQLRIIDAIIRLVWVGSINNVAIDYAKMADAIVAALPHDDIDSDAITESEMAAALEAAVPRIAKAVAAEAAARLAA